MSNNTTHWDFDHPKFMVDYHPILIICCVIICITNASVIMLFLTQASLRSAANYLLFSLAISDLAVGIIGIPVNFLCEMLGEWKACLSSYTINRFIAVSTTYHIFWITLEKYSAIIFPLWHKSHFDKKKVKYTCLCTWLASVLASVVELSWLAQEYDPFGYVTEDVRRKEIIYNIFIFTSVFVFPIAVMIFAYISIFLQIVRQNSNEFLRKHMRNNESSQQGPQRISRHTKSALLFFVILLVFILGWFWWFFMIIYYNIFNYETQLVPIPVLKFLTILRYITAFINPILYTFLKRDFSKAVKKFTNRSRLTPIMELQRTRNSTVLYRPNRSLFVHFDLSSERRC